MREGQIGEIGKLNKISLCSQGESNMSNAPILSDTGVTDAVNYTMGVACRPTLASSCIFTDKTSLRLIRRGWGRTDAIHWVVKALSQNRSYSLGFKRTLLKLPRIACRISDIS